MELDVFPLARGVQGACKGGKTALKLPLPSLCLLSPRLPGMDVKQDGELNPKLAPAQPW